VLRCVRDDGSYTGQKQTSRQAPFFALHDLTHFAVETTLGFQRGFFGLVAEGWDLEDTTGKGSRGPLPEEAGVVEHIVGMLDNEPASGAIWTAEEFHQHFAHPAAPRLTDEDLARVRARRAELFRQWSEIAPGATLELLFDREESRVG